MLTYILTETNDYTIRVEPTGSNSLTMSLEDMTTQMTSSASLSGITYNGYESMLSFTASIASASIAQEFRASIVNGTTEIWHGSIQVYQSQSFVVDSKANYQNQNKQYISNVSENEYIIL